MHRFSFLFVVFGILSAPALAEKAWTVEAVQGTRWPEAADPEVSESAEGEPAEPVAVNPVTLELEPGAEVEVVYRTEDRVRVFVGGDFGWVPEGALTTESPVESDTGNPEARSIDDEGTAPESPEADETAGAGPEPRPAAEPAPAPSPTPEPDPASAD